jgi:hypothetical protein
VAFHVARVEAEGHTNKHSHIALGAFGALRSGFGRPIYPCFESNLSYLDSTSEPTTIKITSTQSSFIGQGQLKFLFSSRHLGTKSHTPSGGPFILMALSGGDGSRHGMDKRYIQYRSGYRALIHTSRRSITQYHLCSRRLSLATSLLPQASGCHDDMQRVTKSYPIHTRHSSIKLFLGAVESRLPC